MKKKYQTNNMENERAKTYVKKGHETNVYSRHQMPLRLPRETLQIEVHTRTPRCSTSRAPQIFGPACTMVRFF